MNEHVPKGIFRITNEANKLLFGHAKFIVTLYTRQFHCNYHANVMKWNFLCFYLYITHIVLNLT